MSSLVEVAEYLVLKAVTGARWVIDILYEYFVAGKSLSAVARGFGVSRAMVRCYVDRVRSKCLYSDARARALIKALYPIVRSIEPVFVCSEEIGRCICMLCNEAVSPRNRDFHILDFHRDYLEARVSKVIEELRRRCNNGRRT